ncbi:MAG: IS110 family transposase [Planctomycetia bacterium]
MGDRQLRRTPPLTCRRGAESHVSEKADVPRRSGAAPHVLRFRPWRPGGRGSTPCDAGGLPSTSGTRSRAGRRRRSPRTNWVGVDVSQHTLDACLPPTPGGKPRGRAFANNPQGHAELIAWADEHSSAACLGFCLESTGAYGEALACALADPGRYVAVVNPARVKYVGLMRGQGDKTDRADARLIAEYAVREQPAPWQPPAPEVREPVRRTTAFLEREADRLQAQAGQARRRLRSVA